MDLENNLYRIYTLTGKELDDLGKWYRCKRQNFLFFKETDENYRGRLICAIHNHEMLIGAIYNCEMLKHKNLKIKRTVNIKLDDKFIKEWEEAKKNLRKQAFFEFRKKGFCAIDAWRMSTIP